jgi:hypothetical protein
MKPFTRRSTVRRQAPACLAVVLLLWTASIAAAEDAPPSQPSPGKGLPTLAASDASKSIRLQGQILHSTRGRGRGAVRLDVVSDAGEKVAVLTVNNDTLDAHGLSLRPGERIDARGSLLPGKVPLLVAVEITVDGKTVQLREASEASAAGKVEETDPPAKASPAGEVP